MPPIAEKSSSFGSPDTTFNNKCEQPMPPLLFDENHFDLLKQIDRNPDKHIEQVKLVSLLSKNYSQSKLSTFKGNSLKKFPQGTGLNFENFNTV